MKTGRYTEEVILAIVRQAGCRWRKCAVPCCAVLCCAVLCCEQGMSNASFYKWRAKYAGLDASLISQMKAMEDEKLRLMRIYAASACKLIC